MSVPVSADSSDRFSGGTLDLAEAETDVQDLWLIMNVNRPLMKSHGAKSYTGFEHHQPTNVYRSHRKHMLSDRLCTVRGTRRHLRPGPIENMKHTTVHSTATPQDWDRHRNWHREGRYQGNECCEPR